MSWASIKAAVSLGIASVTSSADYLEENVERKISSAVHSVSKTVKAVPHELKSVFQKSAKKSAVSLTATNTPNSTLSSCPLAIQTVPEGIGLTIAQMQAIFPNGNPEVLAASTIYINKYGKDFGLDNKTALKHFLSQAGVETGYLQKINSTEKLDYTIKNIIDNVPEKYLIGKTPSDYAHNPERFANFRYGGRMGNGPEETGDGWKYRGRGELQMTGKDQYIAFADFMKTVHCDESDFVANPDLVSNNPEYAVLSALWVFKEKVIDKGIKLDDSSSSISKVSTSINGGDNGIADRQAFYPQVNKIIGK